MNTALLHKEVQEFIAENYKSELSKIVFQGSPFKEVSIQELATQLRGKRKAEKKLPTWFNAEGIVYPPTTNLEQTSSEVTARYKARLSAGSAVLDVSGGFGIDSYFFSKNFEQVVHCELDAELSELAAHNAKVLKADNIRTFNGDGIKFLQDSEEEFDLIYIDPSRRSDTGGRVFQLSECLPNVPEHLELLLERSPNVLVKTSPLLDLRAGILSLQQVREIHIVAVNNDVKELLWLLSRSASHKISIKTLNFKKGSMETYNSEFGKEAGPKYSPPLSFLYEPNAAIMKSGLFDVLGEDFQLMKLHPNSQLFTSEELKGFPGRRFQILKILPFSRKKLRRALDFDKAHITTRNFPETATALRKQLKLEDGGEHYLFFTTTGKNEKTVLVCRKAAHTSCSNGIEESE